MNIVTCTASDRETLATATTILDRWKEVHPGAAPYHTPEWYEEELVLTLTQDRSQCYIHCWIDSRGRLVEFEYSDGDLVSIEIDGWPVWSAVEEWSHPINRLIAAFETDTIVADIEAAYRLSLNPLPALRKVLGDAFVVKFGIDTGDTFFPAEDDRDTLVIWMRDDEASIRWEWIPAEPPPREKLKGEVVIPDGWPWN